MNLTIGVLGHTFNVLRGYEENAIDGWIFKKLQSISILRIPTRRKEFWRPVFEKVVLLLSDYQLLFGIAILIAGLWKHCSISAYHFSLVIDLAWFANTHLTSLSILRCYLQERPTLRNWRVCIMVLMMLMMLAGLVLASAFNWGPSLSCPAQCLFNEPRDFSLTYPYFVALVTHYSTSIWRIYDTKRFDRRFLDIPRETLKGIERSAKRTNSNLSSMSSKGLQTAGVGVIAYRWLLALGIRFYLAIVAILGSLTISLYYDICWFALGMLTIMETRKIPGQVGIDGNENELTFGQIVPMLLLGSIVLTFKGVYTGAFRFMIRGHMLRGHDRVRAKNQVRCRGCASQVTYRASRFSTDGAGHGEGKRSARPRRSRDWPWSVEDINSPFQRKSSYHAQMT